jgi:hypothetical protein
MLPRSISGASGEKAMYQVGQQIEDPNTGQELIIQCVDDGYVLLLCKVRRKAAARVKAAPSKTGEKQNGAARPAVMHETA